MEIRELQAFVKVVQFGSFTRAAENLGMQKAHLSRVIALMERKLNVRLLERTTRSLSLTEIGREIFERAISIVSAVEDAERVVQQVHAEPRGTLRITCGVEFGLMAVSRWISDYMERNPEVRVDADFTGRVIDIVHEGFDLAIRIGHLSDSTLVARRLGELRYGLFASESYLGQRGMPDAPEDLAGHDLLHFTGGEDRQYWEMQCGERKVTVSVMPRLRINSSFAVRDAVVRGLGIGRLPVALVADMPPARQLVTVLSTWQLPSVPVSAVFPGVRYLTPKVRSFIEYATSAFDDVGYVTAEFPSGTRRWADKRPY